MSLQTRLEALVSAIGADVKSLKISAAPGNLLNNGSGYLIARDGSASVDSLGSGFPTAAGTVTASARSIINKHNRAKRVDYLVTAAATNAVAGYRMGPARLVRGNAIGVGGFLSRQLWGPATGVAITTSRAFVGLGSTTVAPTDVEPSTQVNCIGMGWDAADVNMQIMYNDGVGVCVKVDLGANFPVDTVDRTGWYSLDIWCAANEAKLNWKVTNIVTGVVVTGNTGVSTDIPSNITYLAERGWMSTGGTSSVIGIAFGGLYFETEPY